MHNVVHIKLSKMCFREISIGYNVVNFNMLITFIIIKKFLTLSSYLRNENKEARDKSQHSVHIYILILYVKLRKEIIRN